MLNLLLHSWLVLLKKKNIQSSAEWNIFKQGSSKYVGQVRQKHSPFEILRLK
jgi:hypothetical protein